MQSDGTTTVTLRIRQWMRAQIEATLAAGEAAELPKLAAMAEAALLSDEQFNRQIGDMVRILAVKAGRELFSGSRHDSGPVLFGDAVMEREQAEEEAAKGARQNKALSRWATWVEHAGTRYVPLMRMAREDLLSAAAEREKRSETERETAALWRALAQRLEGGQAVGDKFTAEEIEAELTKLRQQRTKQIIDAAVARKR